MDQNEFTRRIQVYLQDDLPEVPEPQRIADVLGARLFQYVEQQKEPPDPASPVLAALLPPKALLFFTATWDDRSQRYGQRYKRSHNGSGGAWSKST